MDIALRARPRPGRRSGLLVAEEDGVDGLTGVVSLGAAVGRGARADEVARTLTTMRLGRDLLRAIERGAAPPSIARGVIRTLAAAQRRAEQLGATHVA
jgi:hypothetical protein